MLRWNIVHIIFKLEATSKDYFVGPTVLYDNKLAEHPSNLGVFVSSPYSFLFVCLFFISTVPPSYDWITEYESLSERFILKRKDNFLSTLDKVITEYIFARICTYNASDGQFFFFFALKAFFTYGTVFVFKPILYIDMT